jgi:hypothetical protein
MRVANEEEDQEEILKLQQVEVERRLTLQRCLAITSDLIWMTVGLSLRFLVVLLIAREDLLREQVTETSF